MKISNIKNIKKTFAFAILFSTLFVNKIFATTFFSGYAGGKLNYSANSGSEDYDPDLKLQAFFAGQFNFSKNIWSHLEFSIDTGDFISESIFHETDAVFQVDEVSLILRGNMENTTNYFSAFMGTYDPIGSDVFLQRYFSIEKIASKITDSYLGLAGSILYPHFGVGISDVIKIHALPLAFGGYMYFNHEDSKYFVFNMDLRAACVFRYFTMDFACGIGAPLADKYKGEDVYIAIDKFYWHTGTTILFGNNYTTSFFLQAGLYNMTFKAKQDSLVVSSDDVYLLLEPRFLTQNFHINISLYSLPSATVKKLLYVDDTLGLDFNFYSDNAMIGNKQFTIGTHLSASLTDKYIFDIGDFKNLSSNGYNINITPYIQTAFLSGELHLQAKLKLMDIAKKSIGKSLSCDLGYRTTF